jgi:hypothetical protein
MLLGRVANVLAALSKSVHGGVETDLAEVRNTQDSRRSTVVIKTLEPAHGANSWKAVAKITYGVECPHETTADDRKGESARHLRQKMRKLRWLPSGHFVPGVARWRRGCQPIRDGGPTR